MGVYFSTVEKLAMFKNHSFKKILIRNIITDLQKSNLLEIKCLETVGDHWKQAYFYVTCYHVKIDIKRKHFEHWYQKIIGIQKRLGISSVNESYKIVCNYGQFNGNQLSRFAFYRRRVTLVIV